MTLFIFKALLNGCPLYFLTHFPILDKKFSIGSNLSGLFPFLDILLSLDTSFIGYYTKIICSQSHKFLSNPFPALSHVQFLRDQGLTALMIEDAVPLCISRTIWGKVIFSWMPHLKHRSALWRVYSLTSTYF